MGEPIRVLIVDDSVVVRRLVERALASDPDIEVVGTARNGDVGLEKIESLRPDLVTLDIEMPVRDGLETLRELRRRRIDVPVIMFSTLTERGARASMEALALGARDYVTKPTNVSDRETALQRVREELLPRTKALCRRTRVVRRTPPPSPRPKPQPATAPQVVVIGVSTGGPNALDELIPALPAAFSLPILIVQHMPPVFTAQLAARLDRHAKLAVQEGCDGTPLQAGRVYVAPGGVHMVVERRGAEVVLALNDEPPENSCRPAVDPLLRAAARVYGAATLAVVMTGMGSDGLHGCEAVHAAGGRILAQDEESSVVWGMPGFVVQAGLADAVHPLDQLAPAIVACTRRGAADVPAPLAPGR